MEFKGSRDALAAKRKVLRTEGKGLHPNAATALTAQEEDHLWRAGHLGDHSPETLTRTCWPQTTMHFGWRGRDEQRKVCFGDLRLKADPAADGCEYVEFCVECGTKTRYGLEGQQERLFPPRMYATGNSRCPVSIFKKMIAHRPPDVMQPNDPFFLAIIPSPKGDVWFKVAIYNDFGSDYQI